MIVQPICPACIHDVPTISYEIDPTKSFSHFRKYKRIWLCIGMNRLRKFAMQSFYESISTLNYFSPLSAATIIFHGRNTNEVKLVSISN